MKKLFLLLPIILLFIVGCDEYTEVKWDRVTYAAEIEGKEVLLGKGTEKIWLVRHTDNNVTFRRVPNVSSGHVYDYQVPKSTIIWIEQHPDQLPMPDLTE